MDPRTPGSTVQSGTPPAGPTAKSRRWKRAALVLVVFLLGVLIGWLLAPRCPQCPGGSGGDGREHGMAAATTGRGPGAKIGTGTGSGNASGGTGTAHGDTQGRGYSGGGPGAAGDAGGGGGGNGNSEGGGGDSQASKQEDSALRTAMIRHAEGLGPLGDGKAHAATPQVDGKVLSAPDFTYDRTGLPRYASGVQFVESVVTFEKPDDPSNYVSSVGITTADDFDTVVSWYRSQLPPGWHDQSVGDLARLAQQLSTQNIVGMLGGASGSSANAPAAAARVTDGAQRAQVAVFSPPAGTRGAPGVMVVKRGAEPVLVMLKAKSLP